MKIGMSIAVPSAGPNRKAELEALRDTAEQALALGVLVRARQHDIYANGYPLQDLLEAIGTQMLESVNRNAAEYPVETPTLEDVKRLAKDGYIINALKAYREYQTTVPGGDTSLLAAKHYVDDLREQLAKAGRHVEPSNWKK